MPVTSSSASATFTVTPADMVRSALLDLRVIAENESVSGGQQEDGRQKLNAMLDTWNTEGLLVNSLVRNAKVLTASKASYTIGSSGDINVTQPILLQKAMLIPNGGSLEQEVRILTARQWEELPDKSTQGTPTDLYFQKSSDTQGTIYLYFIPDGAHTLALYLPVQFSAIAKDKMSESYLLPPGYLEAVQWNLAVRLGPSYAEVNSPEFIQVSEMARSAKARVMRVNMEPVSIECDAAILPAPYFNIQGGDFR